jgi:hypothetical protein
VIDPRGQDVSPPVLAPDHDFNVILNFPTIELM